MTRIGELASTASSVLDTTSHALWKAVALIITLALSYA